MARVRRVVIVEDELDLDDLVRVIADGMVARHATGRRVMSRDVQFVYGDQEIVGASIKLELEGD